MTRLDQVMDHVFVVSLMPSVPLQPYCRRTVFA